MKSYLQSCSSQQVSLVSHNAELKEMSDYTIGLPSRPSSLWRLLLQLHQATMISKHLVFLQ